MGARNNFHDNLFCLNGAEFRDTNGNLIKSENIDTDLARFVCEKLHRENLGFEINTDRGDYTTTMELAEYSDYLEDGYEKLFEEKHNIRKILVFCDDIPKIRRIKQQIYDASGLSVLSSFENNMEVTSQKAKKGIMLKQAMKHFGFLPEEVVVFGDGENDICMLQCTDNSFTFNHVETVIKNSAQYHFDTIEQMLAFINQK